MQPPVNLPVLLNFIAAAPAVSTDGLRVLKRRQLDAKTLGDLIAEKVAVIHIPGYCDPALAARAAKAVVVRFPLNTKNYGKLTRDGHHLDVNYPVATPKVLGMTSKTSSARYFREASRANQHIRDLFGRELSPLDRLRLELDEVWPAGCHVTKTKGKTNLAGSIRHMTAETLIPGLPEGYCHIDDPNRFDFRRYFSACIYLKVPSRGGELNVWDVSYTPENSVNPLIKLCNRPEPELQRAIRQRLPKPLVVKPAPGDLILFDVGRPHAVSGFARGERICIQSFVRINRETGVLSMNS